MKTLLFVLAVAASQVELYLSVPYQSGDSFNIDSCPIYFYGNAYKEATVEFHADQSFSLCFNNNDQQDCVEVVDHSGADTVDMTASKEPVTIPNSLISAFPDFTDKADCNIVLSLNAEAGELMKLQFFNLDRMTVLSFVARDEYSPANVKLMTKIGDSIVESVSPSSNNALLPQYMNLQGCRSLTSFASLDRSRMNPETCTRSECDLSDPYTLIETGCPSSQFCKSNECVPVPPVCTATGSTVVDFFNTVHDIRDVCAYTLMSNAEVVISIDLRERHLTNVPFLNRVTVELPQAGKEILLEQGGVVRVGSDILALTSTPQTLHGVELSKDATGVTLKTPVYHTIVHFDGDSVHVTGDNGEPTGACGNPATGSASTEPMDWFLSPSSPQGCAVSQSQDVSGSEDCSASDDYCDRMSQDYFAACRAIDPEPFITACKKKACKYTADGRPADYMACQYMEAYARACFMKLEVTLGDWRSPASCPATRQSSCLKQYCSDHEFCAGEPGCFCRASFDHPRDSIAKPTVCEDGSLTVTLPECLLREKGIDPSALNLEDTSCTGVSDRETHMLTFLTKGDACGTTVETTSTKLTYKNKILMGTTPLNDITRHKIVEIDFSCSVTLTETETTSFNIGDGSVVQIIDNGVFAYTLTMSAFTDAGFVQPVEGSTVIDLNQRVWLQIGGIGLDGSLIAVVTDSCWATKEASPTSTPKYDLVIDGCPNPADPTVEMVGNGVGVSNSFSFLMFEFKTVPKVATVYLHCKVELCPASATCAPTCGGARKRRSARPGYAPGGHALITMVWSN